MIQIEKALYLIDETMKNGRRELSLNNLELEEIPDKLYKLKDQLVSINLMDNKLSYLPDFFGEFTKLKQLHLSDNNFTEFPKVIMNLKRLDHLCLRNNRISEIPNGIEKLENLSDLELNNNLIEILPISLSNIDVLLNLEVKGNPIKDPPPEILAKGAAGIFKYLYEKEKGKIFKIPIAKEVRTAFKQYLINFNDYVKAAKGKDIDFEVRNFEEGLEIEIKIKDDEALQLVENYLQEYVGFIKSNIDNININYEIETSTAKDELLRLQVKSEVQHLRMKLEISEFKVKHLEQEVDRINNLLVLNVSNPKPILISVAQNNQVQNNQYNNEIREEFEELSLLFEKILDSSNLSNNDANAILEIKNDLGELQNSGNIEEIQRANVWGKIKELIGNLLKGSEDVGKGVKGAQNTLEGLQLIYKKIKYIVELLQNIG